jgi:hypothetical protein
LHAKPFKWWLKACLEALFKSNLIFRFRCVSLRTRRQIICRDIEI